MPMPLMIVYRVLGILLLAMAAAAVWEKYRTVRGATLLPGRILDCRKANRTNPRQGAGGYRYLVEIHAGGSGWNWRPMIPSGSAMTVRRARACWCGITPAVRCWSARAWAPRCWRQ